MHKLRVGHLPDSKWRNIVVELLELPCGHVLERGGKWLHGLRRGDLPGPSRGVDVLELSCGHLVGGRREHVRALLNWSVPANRGLEQLC